LESPIQFGDLVQYCRLTDGAPERAYCIGGVDYAESVIIVATHDGGGFPIDSDRCEIASTGHFEIAQTLRERYESSLASRLTSSSYATSAKAHARL
jgi:hypothetical protein